MSFSDGCGWCLPSVSKKSFQFRMSWFEGLVSPVNWVSWCKQYNNSSVKLSTLMEDRETWYQKELNIYFLNHSSRCGSIILTNLMIMEILLNMVGKHIE